MILDLTDIKILNEPSYSFTANCFEQTLSFNVTWVERLKKRFIVIRGSNGAVYLQNTAISINESLNFNINAEEADYKCSIILQHLPDADTTVDYMNWSRNMFLTVYRYREE